MKKIDLSPRQHCFYWQTDRSLSPQEFEQYFLKRQEITETEITAVLHNGIATIPDIKKLQLVSPDKNVLKGSVNIVRKFVIGEEEYVARLHPKFVKNGYFYAEAVALGEARKNGLPVPKVLEVHTATDENDLDFILTTSSPGRLMQFAIEENPELEHTLLRQAGQMLAYIHQIKVEKFGFFNNEVARTEKKLVGLHDTYREFIFCSLEENLQCLLQYACIDINTAEYFRSIFAEYSFAVTESRLIHNDYADWNILVDEEKISAVLDWDECHGGDPIADLACWSLFFDIARFPELLKGYLTATELPDDFDERFHYYRLRYAISKMALRIQRATVDNSPFVQERITVGKAALHEEETWFRKNG